MISPKYINLFLLVFSFGIGQGSLFIANTYLYQSSEFQLIADFGASYSLLTFVFFITDWGGLVFLAKETVVGQARQRSVDCSYLGLSLFRLAIAALFYIGFTAYALLETEGFFANYCKLAGLGFFAYAFNANGMLDGRSKAGLSGLTLALPILAVSTSLVFCRGLDDATAGGVLGGIHAAGMVCTIILQLLVLRPNWRAALKVLSLKEIGKIARAAFPYMLTPLPGQALLRVQIILATLYLSPPLVALFIYTRQIIGIGYHGLGFYLRVDLKEFADYLQDKAPTALSVMATSMTIRFGLLGTAMLLLAASYLNEGNPDLAQTILIYAPCLAANSVASTLQRVFLLQSRGGENVAILIFSALLPLAALAPLLHLQAVWPLIGIELLSQLLQSALFVGRWQRCPRIPDGAKSDI